MRRYLLAAPLAALVAMPMPAKADLSVGIEMFERGRFEDAARELAPLAESSAPAQYVLGLMYHTQMVVPPEGMSGIDLIHRSAESGYLPAQNELGRIYRTGDGVDQDFAEMMKWYEQAAGQGDVGAQLFVADGYAYGYGVDQNLVEAYKWYEIAIRYWGALAVRAREVVAEEMTEDQIAEAVRRAGEWFAANPEK
jgi:TPR repeat protein